jgi:hypothetical protein
MSLMPSERFANLARYAAPALAAGFIAWCAFLLFGHTPAIRASGLALVIIAVALMLRHWGGMLAVVGALALAFCPAFWSQTGGAESLDPLMVIGALALAVGGALIASWMSKYPTIGLAVAIAIFAALFMTSFGTPRSLRLTALLAAWTLFLLTNALLITNPRPEEDAPQPLNKRHTWGLLMLIVIGVLNDPLFTLMIPAVALGLFLSNQRLSRWYWLGLLAVFLYGAYGIAVTYLDSGWWLFPAARAEALGYRTPYVMADGWRAPARWLYLLGIIIEQFTPLGLVLGVAGLARLARWYPTLGVTSMIAYGTYFLFGLVYFGKDSAVHLLPLLMIQVFWVTYGVYALGQWLQKISTDERIRWLASAAFTLLPLSLLLRITGVL